MLTPEFLRALFLSIIVGNSPIQFVLAFYAQLFWGFAKIFPLAFPMVSHFKLLLTDEERILLVPGMY